MAQIEPKTELPKANISQKSHFWLSNLIKSLIFLLVAALLTGATFWWENKPVAKNVNVLQADLIDLQAEEILIPENGLIRPNETSVFSMENASPKIADDVADHSYVFNFNSGHIWGNFTASDAKVNLVIDRVVLIPNGSAFELSFDGEKIEVKVYEGDVYIGFLPEDVKASEYVDEYSPLFSNRLLIPRDSQVEIPLSKIDARLEKLLYTKLIKEFKYGALPENSRESEFVKNNERLDRTFIETLKQNYRSDLLQKGARNRDGFWGDFIFQMEEALTFAPERKEDLQFEHLFSFLDDALYYAEADEKALSEEKFRDFEAYLSTLSGQALLEFESGFENVVNKFSIFGPADKEYFLLKLFLKRQFNSEENQYEIVKKIWLDVYKGLAVNDKITEGALNEYYTFLDLTLNPTTIDPNFEIYLTYQNQLFDNLFLRYGLFYKDGYFAIKNAIETNLLDLFDEGQPKEELKQAIVSRKIDFLKRLRAFFFAGEIEVKDAKEIISRLISEIDDLMPAESDALAVTKLFETQLNDIGDFWGYLNSPEYHVSKTYGFTHEEKYKSYLVEKDKIWSFVDIQSEVLGEENAPDLTVEDVRKLIEEKLSGYENVTDVTVSEISDVSQRYVEISVTLGGYPFTATYDRDQENLKEVYVYGELVSERPVKITNLLTLMQNKFSDIAEEELKLPEEISEETAAQRIARIYIAEEVTKAGLIASMENVSIIDELEFLYRVKDIYVEEFPDIFVTFDYVAKGELVTNLIMVVKGESKSFEGEFTLAELKDIVIAENDFATKPESAESPGKISR